MASLVAKSPALLAIQREKPPSLAGSTASLSARELIEDAEDEVTVLVPQPLFTFLTSADHTVTACLANSTIDSPVRVIAEHLFGLDYGSFKQWTQEEKAMAPPSAPATPKGVRAWLHKLSLKPKPKRQHALKEHVEAGSAEDDSDVEQVVDDHYSAIERLNPEQLAEVKRCGQWRGAEPSEAFLNIYAQAILTLEKNVLNGLVSPPLMGSTGVAPLTLISHTTDIVQHYADIIVAAEHEIFFTTNVWEASKSAAAIKDALIELSRRTVERGGEKVVVKIMYDRGGVAPSDGRVHQIVEPSVYSSPAVGLPTPEEIPGLELEVQNYHIPPVGTFHQKCLVIDRKIASLSSNNIQERGDVGFMVQLEGPVVQSIYDTAILSWWTSFHPPLPLLGQAPHYPKKLDASFFKFGADLPAMSVKEDAAVIAERTRQRLAKLNAVGKKLDSEASTPVQSSTPVPSTPVVEAPEAEPAPTTPTEPARAFNPIILHEPHAPFPVAVINRTPRALRGQGDGYVPQNLAWLAAIKFAQTSVFIQSPTFSAKPIVSAALDAVRRGVLVEIYADLEFNDEGEISADGLANRNVAAFMYSQLAEAERDNLRIYWYTAKDQHTPLTARHTCHIKLMIVDGTIAITGNGNVNHQSWFHSQELNILVDSEQLCTDWRAGIDSNQNTRVCGRVQPDGVWRDAAGRELPTRASTPLAASPSLGSPVPSTKKLA
ncbi:hypothetical protein Q8F55_004673 [Vanrija albida]|uniref:PLD phosphodiesterase domain-containing protein n=1 Tax=Vanrija albida TaxID=181172 RepID=A0ABR3Q7F1_9TREE